MIANIGSWIRVAMALGAVLGASACTPESAGPDGACGGVALGTTLDVVETGKTVDVTCMTFATAGVPKENPHYRHIAEIRLEGGAILSLFFPNATAAGTTLTFGGDSVEFGVDLFDYGGFEGGPRRLCATRPGFPSDAAVSGAVTIDALTVRADGFLGELHGSIEASFDGCTVERLGVNNQPLTLRGDF